MPSDSRSSRKHLTERRQSSPPSRPWSFPFDPPIDPAACRAAPLPRQFPFRHPVPCCRQQRDNFYGLPVQNFPRRQDGDAGRHPSPGRFVPSTLFAPARDTHRHPLQLPDTVPVRLRCEHQEVAVLLQAASTASFHPPLPDPTLRHLENKGYQNRHRYSAGELDPVHT